MRRIMDYLRDLFVPPKTTTTTTTSITTTTTTDERQAVTRRLKAQRTALEAIDVQVDAQRARKR